MSDTNRIISYGISSDEIIARMKADLKNPPNKVEGSFASDNIQAVGKEIAKYYHFIDFLQDMHYVETASGEFLDKKAIEVGIERKKPTKARGRAKFIGNKGTFIPAGFRISDETGSYITRQFATIEDSEIILPIEAVVAGSKFNKASGTSFRFDSLPGLREVIAVSDINNGTDLEDDNSLRDRTLLRMRYPGTSGNQYHYMHWAMEVEGVGRVKVFPLYDGPGTVKVSILDSNQRVANENLILEVQNHIDNGGERLGEALAPIGAYLKVSTAKTKTVDISGEIMLEPGSRLNREMVADRLKNELQKYIDESVSYKVNRLTVAKVIDILYSIEGVSDIVSISVNGVNDSISFGAEEIPVVGDVSL